MPRLAVLLGLLALLLAACGSGGGGKKTPGTTVRPTTASTARPATAAATPSPTQGTARIPNVAPDTSISLPAGFAAYVVAEGYKNPTSISLAPDGALFLSQANGNIFRLVDANGDGVYEQSDRFASLSPTVTGVLVGPDGTVYASSTGKITAMQGDQTQEIITGLPTDRHQNNGLAIGPDGKLYYTNGSTCDDCVEQDPRSATIQQANLDGTGARIYATGLRNSYDLTFDDRGRLWATDNGSDAPCATIDELNLIVDGGDYGWPYSSKGCDAYTADIPPVADLGLHTAATGIAFYNGGQFPPEYRGNFFITLWGDFGFTSEHAGHYMVRVTIDESSGKPVGTAQQFGTGFSGPIDVVVDRDGSLLVADYGTGKVYRILYTGA